MNTNWSYILCLLYSEVLLYTVNDFVAFILLTVYANHIDTIPRISETTINPTSTHPQSSQESTMDTTPSATNTTHITITTLYPFLYSYPHTYPKHYLPLNHHHHHPYSDNSCPSVGDGWNVCVLHSCCVCNEDQVSRGCGQ